MALYFLTYDLRDSRDYEVLYSELRRFSAVRVLKSTWCFHHQNTSTVALRDHVRQILDADDGLIVTNIDGWASYKTDGTPKDL